MSLKQEIKTFNYDEKKKIVERIQNLKNKKQYLKLYKIVNKSNINMTKNGNGIFFNLNKLPNDILIDVDNYLTKIESQKDLITDSDLSFESSDNIFSINESSGSSISNSNNDNTDLKLNLKKKILND